MDETPNMNPTEGGEATPEAPEATPEGTPSEESTE